MTYTVTEIDKYLKNNKFDFYNLITEGWGKKDKDVIEIKRLWQEAEDAVGTNSQIEKFKKLQDKLNPFFDRAKERLEKDEKTLIENNAESFPDPNDQADHMFDKALIKFSEWPKADKFENLSMENAYGDNDGGKPYDNEQMTRLAEEYGYDYKDPEERKEFLGYVSDAVQNKELDKIWNDGTLYGAYTNLVTPVAREYAQKNYDKIKTVSDLAPALAADVGINTMMAGAPGGIAKNLGGSNTIARVFDNTVAPAMRAAATVGINDKDKREAIVDAANEVATNYATPWMLRSIFRKADRYAQKEINKAQKALVAGTDKEKKQAIKTITNDQLNKAADKSRIIEDKLKNGSIVQDEKGNLFKFSKDGKMIAATEKDMLYSDVVSLDDFKYYLQNKHIMRGKNWGPESKSLTETMNDMLEAPLTAPGLSITEKSQLMKVNKDAAKTLVDKTRRETVVKQMKENIKAGKPATDGISAEELALFTDKTPKETKWNWATAKKDKIRDKVADSFIGEAGGSYLTNLQGRSKWGGTALNTFAQVIPEDIRGNIEVTEKKVDQNDPEVKIYKRNYMLHQANPTLVNAPKKPEKYKDFSIQEIFGE